MYLTGQQMRQLTKCAYMLWRDVSNWWKKRQETKKNAEEQKTATEHKSGGK